MKKITVHNSSTDDTPSNSMEFLKWFSEKVESIPYEFRESAEIHINYGGVDSSEQTSVEIIYYRSETNTEHLYRIKLENEAREAMRNKDWKLLGELRIAVLPFVDDGTWSQNFISWV